MSREDYGVTAFDKLFCTVVRKIIGTNKYPKFIHKMSLKKYGRLDCLARYWWKKYNNIDIGDYTYGYQYLGNGRLKSIGKYCSIAPGTYLTAGNHNMEMVTTSPAVDDYKAEPWSQNIIIGNDVWIGVNCTIFAGVTIGDGAVIAAGAIVRKDVPPYAVVGGVDRILKYRFSEEIIEKLLKIQWWNWDYKTIKENEAYFQDTEKFVEHFDKF